LDAINKGIKVNFAKNQGMTASNFSSIDETTLFNSILQVFQDNFDKISSEESIKHHITSIHNVYKQQALSKELDNLIEKCSEEASLIDIFKFVNESKCLNEPNKMKEIDKMVFMIFQMDVDFLVQINKIKRFYDQYVDSKLDYMI
jgi:hypothetical protein